MSGTAPVEDGGTAARAENCGPQLASLGPRKYLQAVGEGAEDSLDIANAALACAALDRPDRDLGAYVDHLEQLAASAAAATSAAASVEMQAEGVLDVLARTYGYRGDAESYDDLRNADLMEVIDRRQGLPVALGILYMHAVRAYGGRVSGLAFPAHFCIRIEARGQRLIIDPFDGSMLSARDLRQRLKERVHQDAEILPAHHQPVGSREILLRLQNNIRVRTLRAGRLDRALAVIERMTLISPERGDFRREMALIHARKGDVAAAIRVIEEYVAQRGAAGPPPADLAALLRQLKASAAT
ncbi:MAG TPA: tetratricopeptide repeat protein [Rhodospirillales bacterium]|nr:tetratricopeptide repeat protein [Rhodospirillales bacterium]